MALRTATMSTAPLLLMRTLSVARLTLAAAMPGTAATAFSTRPAHDAQVMSATGRVTSVGSAGVDAERMIVVRLKDDMVSIDLAIMGRSRAAVGMNIAPAMLAPIAAKD